jgi:poly(hydroxyalkanoate) granule-associated protein
MDPNTTQTGPGNSNKKLQDELVESAHRIWLAGLGALAAAEEEGTKVFNRLVDRGKDVESRGKQQYGDVRSRAENAWSGVGDKVDEKVTAALHRLGVPTRDEIRDLTRKVEELNSKVEELRPRVTPAKTTKVTV